MVGAVRLNLSLRLPVVRHSLVDIGLCQPWSCGNLRFQPFWEPC